jgi:hypothetical protein
MIAMTTLTPQQLRKAANLKEEIDQLQAQLNDLLNEGSGVPAARAVAPPARGRRRGRLSAQGRANISAAAKARWAARRLLKGKGSAAGQPAAPAKEQRSAAWRSALSAAMKRRWAKAKQAGKARL